ncbi:heavy metal-responsive transcriptional regulator [Nevskia sp.]|uniref:heavy metal-responsive transcriptional regulator n=1 Tax=Nevskia sp. TaxID=1929292 RepID=UPI0025ECF1C9|nr:heavy metal-responsive transcriptional regulator [Nevskia sp.]
MSRTTTIGAAAKAAGVAIDTVRYYEREGLLPVANRSSGGYRLYTAADVERLRFIRQAKALGFTLGDIAGLLQLQDGGGPRQQVREMARARVSELDRKIRELTAIRDTLVALEQQCHGSGTVAGCPIIEGVQSVSLNQSPES